MCRKNPKMVTMVTIGDDVFWTIVTVTIVTIKGKNEGFLKT